MNNAARNVTLLAGLSLAVSTSVASAQPAGELVDSVETPVSVTEQAETIRPTAKRRHLRMALEALAIQSIGTAWYWRNTGDGFGESNRVDWQLGFKGSALANKLSMSSDGWRFDGNSYALNALCHPAFGALTFAVARNNNYSVVEAFLISTLVSGSWETLTEWAEYGSINDILSTSTTGVPLGEAAYQLVHNWRRARYALTLGAGSQSGDAIMSVGGRVALDTLPLEGEGMVVGGRKVGVGIEIPMDGNGGIRSVEAGTKTSLVGYYSAGENHKLFAGASAEFYYRDSKDRESRESDLLATIALGPTVDAQVRHGDVTVDVGTDIYADFGMLKAQAYQNWRAMNPNAVVRNTMQNLARPYYYAGGVTVDPRINVGYKGVNVGGKVVASLFSSMDGADRDQEMLTADEHIKDRDVSGEAWLGYTHKTVTMAVDTRLHSRTGSMGANEGHSNDHTTMVTLSYQR
jgi:hypothetical protein